MEKDNIFFGEQGLTTTSANHLANLAKEACQTVENELMKLSFYGREASLISSDFVKVLKIGDNEETLSEVESKLTYIAGLKSLIAWLREGIKAKERLVKEAKAMADDVIAMSLDLDWCEAPKREAYMTEDDYIATLSIKERNRYYHLQTLCAVIGSYIHPDGHFSEERKDLKDAIAEPVTISGSGRDAIIYTYKPSVSVQKVEDTFFSLQAKHREYQAQLNSMKHQMELAIQEDTRKKDAEYSKAINLYTNKMKAVMAEVVAFRNQKVQEAQALKIIIPDSLKVIYNQMNALGKEK